MLNLEQNDRIRAGWLFFMIISGVLVVIGFTMIDVFAQETATIDAYLTNLDYLFDKTDTVNFIFPLVLMISAVGFTTYALKNKEEQLYSIFSIGAFVVCVVLSLMFISPVVFDLSINVTDVNVIIDPSDEVFTETSKTTYDIPIIPNDRDFRFIFSLFFSLFALFNALISILIITYYPIKHGGKFGKH